MKERDPHPLTAVDNLFDYFHQRVETERIEGSLSLSDDTALYLAQLLVERARADRPAPAFDTLAELHGVASHASPGKQASMYRELGDRALYLLAFFHEHLDRARRPLSPSYYEEMGAAAYHRCDQVLKIWFSDAFGPVFLELARQFNGCVDLLTRVKNAESASIGTVTASGLIIPGNTIEA